MSPEQKVVIVTGASQGIGTSLLKGFRELGYGVVANSRSIEKVDSADDPGVAAVEGDVAVGSTGDRIVSAALDRFGRSTR
jgi:NAD(P)-dependent dehydrogenase (short-subunit alcohol dehydrogenase family)